MAVALRKESVDRNCYLDNIEITQANVALRKESVDRNIMIITICIALKKSLSARRAWIEILGSRLYDMSAAWSLSARRAWIEIKYVVKDSDFAGSLSARRAWIEITAL